MKKFLILTAVGLVNLALYGVQPPLNDSIARFMMALSDGNFEVIERAIIENHDVDLKNIRNSYGETLWHVASRGGSMRYGEQWIELQHSNFISHLLAYLQVQVNAGRMTSERAFALATVQDDNGNTPLHLAAWHGNYELVACWLSWGFQLYQNNWWSLERFLAFVLATNYQRETPRDLAERGNHRNIVALLERGQ